MKQVDQITLPKITMIVIALILIFVLVKFLFERAKKECDTKITDLKRKLRFIEEKISENTKDLNQLKEMKAILDKKVSTRFFIIKSGILTFVLTITSYFFQDRSMPEALSAIVSFTELAWIPLSFTSCLLINKVLDANNLFEWLRLTIELRVYKQNGLDPLKMGMIEEMIKVKESEAEKIRLEIGFRESMLPQEI